MRRKSLARSGKKGYYYFEFQFFAFLFQLSGNFSQALVADEFVTSNPTCRIKLLKTQAYGVANKANKKSKTMKILNHLRMLIMTKGRAFNSIRF